MPRNRSRLAIDLDLSQVDAFAQALADLPATVAMRVASTALEKAAQPMVQAIKARTPVRTGALRKSIAATVRTYPSQKAVLVVGPSKDRFYGGKRIVRGGKSLRGSDRPANYAHLVEFGHRLAAGADGRIGFSRAKGTNLRQGKGAAAAFVLARPFMRPGVAAATPSLLNNLSAGIATGLHREHLNQMRKLRRIKRAA